MFAWSGVMFSSYGVIFSSPGVIFAWPGVVFSHQDDLIIKGHIDASCFTTPTAYLTQMRFTRCGLF